MIDIKSYSDSLRRDADGIWYASDTGPVSYPEHGNAQCRQIEDGSFWFEHRNRCILAAVASRPPSGPLFDIGAGNGFVAQALERAGFPVVALEAGVDGARNARARGLEAVICSTLEASRIRRGSLAAVGLFDVLEHVADDAAFLGDLRSRIVPGGRIYLTVPAGRLLWSDEDEIAGHYRRYSLGGLVTRLSTAGFEVEFATGIFAPLVLPVLLLRSLPSRLRLRRASTTETYSREHGRRGGLLGALLNRSFARELERIGRRRRSRFGTSCLAVARAV
jgi:SAM-dependent methyltransferase